MTVKSKIVWQNVVQALRHTLKFLNILLQSTVGQFVKKQKKIMNIHENDHLFLCYILSKYKAEILNITC